MQVGRRHTGTVKPRQKGDRYPRYPAAPDTVPTTAAAVRGIAKAFRMKKRSFISRRQTVWHWLKLIPNRICMDLGRSVSRNGKAAGQHSSPLCYWIRANTVWSGWTEGVCFPSGPGRNAASWRNNIGFPAWCESFVVSGWNRERSALLNLSHELWNYTRRAFILSDFSLRTHLKMYNYTCEYF